MNVTQPEPKPAALDQIRVGFTIAAPLRLHLDLQARAAAERISVSELCRRLLSAGMNSVQR